jgi:hypothetical protein
MIHISFLDWMDQTTCDDKLAYQSRSQRRSNILAMRDAIPGKLKLFPRI